MEENISERIKELISFLNSATKAYDGGHPIISDKEWDDKYFELKSLEDTYNIKFNNSPTRSIYFETVNSLEKVVHNHDMLSLEKTKALEEVKDFLGNQPYLAMCKMDGLTCSLRYLNGKLESAETRGDGKIGENVLHNANVIRSIPKEIDYKDELIIDGEIICTYFNFEQFTNDYKNPRNFASGSIRLLDSKECFNRHLTFVVWDVVKGFEELLFLHQKFSKLIELKFTVVPYVINYSPEESSKKIKEMAQDESYPIDGIVYKFDDIAYGKTLGKTAHHFKNAIAYKFYDETYSTVLRNIEWTMGRTGVLTPIAIFDPVDIEGSIVSRASLHNISIMQEVLGVPYKNQKLEIFKANMIIPQVYSAEKLKEPIEESIINIPNICPICGETLEIVENNNTKTLMCKNSSCDGKFINKLDHFCGKKGLDIKGLSKATLGKLMDWGWLNNYEDLFNLRKHSTEWKKKPGFGEKSVEKILNTIDESSHCNLTNFIAAIGIPLIGSTASRDLTNYFKTWPEFIEAINTGYHFWEIPNFGLEMHNAIMNFNYKEAENLYEKYLFINVPIEEEKNTKNNLNNLSIVITGKLNHFKNRDALKSVIESHGGKVVNSISGKTSYLINNDVNSSSSKNVAAKKYNIPIISEENFIKTFGI